MSATEETKTTSIDPRALLAEWANDQDEWVRFVTGEVITTGAVLSDTTVETAYDLFRQEKGLDERTVPEVASLSTDAAIDETAPPLTITKLSDVRGVNALTPGGEIEPHEGLTILYGENGTGKTGYARIFKALAKSRTAEQILGDVEATTPESPSARIEYRIGGTPAAIDWKGEHGVAPFTRMSIFDTPCVSYHVDEALEYVYVPAALALFEHVNAAIREVQALIDRRIDELHTVSTTLLSRFPRESSVYAQIETLGASTDLPALKAKADHDPKVDERLESLQRTVAALEADTLPAQITLRQREKRVLEQAVQLANGLLGFDARRYNDLLAKRASLVSDRDAFRAQLFDAANLPAEPETTWTAFIEAGEAYRQHLSQAGAHDAARCLYCRQPLGDAARELLAKYSTYLEDKLSTDLRAVRQELRSLAQSVKDLERPDVAAFLADQASAEDKPSFYAALSAILGSRDSLWETMKAEELWGDDLVVDVADPSAELASALGTTATKLEELQDQAADRATALRDAKSNLNELKAAAELARSWTAIETQVTNAKEADQLTRLKARFRGLLRGLTDLSKEASDQLINQNFGLLFAEECEALRAPALKVQYVGRQGKPQRKKTLSVEHKPSLVLSEGEQKVLAIADFLAEARLAGITAPVIFDDPVSSLDHRRAAEIAERILVLAEHHQVIVFTHDILFTTTLLLLFEKSKRCVYYQVTDENGKGKVTKATGPRWDTLSNIKKEINKTVQAAEQQEGEARAALVRTGYDWLRSWCEVFTETELLKGVTQRYQPNVRMTTLANINTEKLPELIATVTKVFDDACRYIDGHSQPLPTLGVSPTLEGLKSDWATLETAKKINEGKDVDGKH